MNNWLWDQVALMGIGALVGMMVGAAVMDSAWRRWRARHRRRS